MSKEKKVKSKSILRSLITASVTIIVGMVLFFVAVLVLLTMLSITTKSDAYWALIILPVATVFAVPFVYLVNKRAAKHIDTLSNGINRVANGDLTARIEDDDPIFRDVYNNFNKMVGEIRSVRELRNGIVDGFSHELKTPISSINGCAKLLLDGNLSEEKSNKYLQIILRDSERMAQFVHDMLLLTKLDAEEIVTDKTEYDLSEQIRDCLIGLSSKWEQKDLNLSVELDDCIYYGNKPLMESVWSNLLSNAVKYTPRGGSVGVKMTVTDDEIKVSVSDTGLGISEEALPHIFDRFYRADSSEGGHGLGLSIVSKAIALIGGKIDVKSKVGEGSEFIITLKNEKSNNLR